MKFWDASALIPLCLTQPETASVVPLARDEPLVVWWSSPVECCSAFSRMRREHRLSDAAEREILAILDRLSKAWIEIEPTLRVRENAQRLLRIHPLRSADALQLAAALAWAEHRPSNRPFVCLDRRLSEAAAKEGFSVLPPYT